MVTPKLSPINPIIGGITAPPDTAIIINPEISFARSGKRSIDKENTNGKIFAIPNPIMKIIANAATSEGAIINAKIDTKPITEDQMKNLLEDSLVNRIAPPKVPNIFPKK